MVHLKSSCDSAPGLSTLGAYYTSYVGSSFLLEQVAAQSLLERADALLKGVPQLQGLGHQGAPTGAFTSLDAYAEARYCSTSEPGLR